MLVVPLQNDRIETTAGLPAKVVSFTNYVSEGPAVLADFADGAELRTVLFADIEQINGKKVRFIKNADGYKVFETDAYISRDIALPQPHDTVEAKLGDNVISTYKVQRWKLHEKNKSSQGLIFDAVEVDSKVESEIRLNQITDIPGELFSKSSFRKLYADYLPKGAA